MAENAVQVQTEEKPEKPQLSVTFRLAAKKDVQSLAKVFVRAFAENNEFREPERYMLQSIANPDMGVFVAETEGKIAGLLMVDTDSFKRGSLYIDQLAVDPDFQGYGVGRQLMMKAENVALAQGFNAVALHVREDNEKAIGLYTSLGYKTIGSEWHYYQDGTAGLKMLKSLKPEPANDNTGWSLPKFLKKVLHSLTP